MYFLYNVAIRGYLLAIRIASLFNVKAKLWIEGRKGWKQKLALIASQKDPVAWFHCASLGEFEQGRPVIEAFREKHPEFKILLSFFSPSGYEIRKNYPKADAVVYIPADTQANVRFFLDKCNPKIVFFIKYEYWFNFIREIHKRNIPLYIISAVFRPDQFIFKWYGTWFRKQLSGISGYFVQNPETADLLKHAGFTNITLTGDTRFDRVGEIAQNKTEFPVIEQFIGQCPVLVAGSTWGADEEILQYWFARNSHNFKLIVVPHEIDGSHLTSIEKRFPKQTIRYSAAVASGTGNARVLIVDTIGLLAQLYQFGNLAYIGGGFGKGIHNILEAAVFGKPILFGPRHRKFREAIELSSLGGAWPVASTDELAETINKLMSDHEIYETASHICSDYVLRKRGATATILQKLTLNHLNSRSSN